MADALTPNNIRVSTTQRVDSTGKQFAQKTVTFNVGTHGPFQFDEPAATLTTEEIKRRIGAQVEELQQLEALQTNG